MSYLAQKQCKPVNPRHKALDVRLIRTLQQQVSHYWKLRKGRLVRTIQCQNAFELINFVSAVTWVAQQQKHSPRFIIEDNRCRIECFTRVVDGLTVNDFIMAARVDEMVTQHKPAEAVRDLTAAHAIDELTERPAKRSDRAARPSELNAVRKPTRLVNRTTSPSTVSTPDADQSSRQGQSARIGEEVKTIPMKPSDARHRNAPGIRQQDLPSAPAAPETTGSVDSKHTGFDQISSNQISSNLIGSDQTKAEPMTPEAQPKPKRESRLLAAIKKKASAAKNATNGTGNHAQKDQTDLLSKAAAHLIDKPFKQRTSEPQVNHQIKADHVSEAQTVADNKTKNENHASGDAGTSSMQSDRQDSANDNKRVVHLNQSSTDATVSEDVIQTQKTTDADLLDLTLDMDEAETLLANNHEEMNEVSMKVKPVEEDFKLELNEQFEELPDANGVRAASGTAEHNVAVVTPEDVTMTTPKSESDRYNDDTLIEIHDDMPTHHLKEKDQQETPTVVLSADDLL